MNFLGHLYFSNNDLELMHANLLGDSIKGSNLSKFPEIIQRGVRLHRATDNYIDTHPAVKELLSKLHEPLPKVSGIAVDLYFDHLLAKNWSSFHGVHLSQFVEAFYTATPKHHSFESKQYKFMIAKMKDMNWLYNYRTHEGLTYACSGLSKRISFDNLLHKAPDVYLENEALITDTFHRFMAEAIPYFEDYFLRN
jgi:acyl carrier protein phosphodiesterase